MNRTLCWLVLLSMCCGASADLIPEGASSARVPFDLVEGRPLIAVDVDGTRGRMLLDNGTPEKMFFNRDALPLAVGAELGRGRAASGQQIVVRRADAPRVSIGGRSIGLPAQVSTGNFGFMHAAFGDDYLGFIGTPFLQKDAFVLDFGGRVITFLRVDAAGTLPLAPPTAAELLVEVNFALHPGGLPVTAGVVGGIPMLVEFDTGDSGTLYLRPETRRQLAAAGAIPAEGEQVVLSRLTLGGACFRQLRVSLLTAGGAADFRPTGPTDLLRLGADFLAQQPSLWNFPARRLSLLVPDSGFMKAIARPMPR